MKSMQRWFGFCTLDPLFKEDIPNAMQESVYARADAKYDVSTNQLLLIPLLCLDFLCVHPIRALNGLMDKPLSLLLLYKSGFEVPSYASSKEQVINMNPGYYEALRQNSAEWRDNSNNYIPFVENFLYVLCLCYEKLIKDFFALSSNKKTAL